MKVSIWDMLSTLFLIATVIVIIVVGIIFFDPDSSINPFPVPTLPPTITVSLATPTQYKLPPTWTPTPQITATPNP